MGNKSKCDILRNTFQIYNSGLLIVKLKRLYPACDEITQFGIIQGYI